MIEQFHDIHDVNVAISNNLVHSFAEIPKHLQSGEVAEEWFVSMIQVKKKPLEDCLSEVPPKFWTAQFMTTVANSGCNILRYIDPGRDPMHLNIGMMCARVNYKNLVSLDPKYNAREIDVIARDFPWVRDHMPASVVHFCCLNIDFAMGYKVLPDGVGKEIMTNGYGFNKIRAHGRLDVLAEQIAEGEWPTILPKSELPGPKPRSLENGIGFISQCMSGSDRESLHMAYLMTYPMDQVIPLLCEDKKARLVLEMYSKEALAPYVKKYRVLRGVVLEEALGL
jgi:hypothetical protein